MKIRTNIAMLGYPSCSVLDIDDDDAASLIARGFAVASSEPADNTLRATPAPPAPADDIETADAPAAAETADAPTPAPRKPAARKPRKPAA